MKQVDLGEWLLDGFGGWYGPPWELCERGKCDICDPLRAWANQTGRGIAFMRRRK